MTKIRKFAFMLFCFTASLVLSSCSNNDEPEISPVTQVNLTIKANFSEDLLSILTPSISLSLNESAGHINTVKKTLNKTSNSISISATSFPASISAPITMELKKVAEKESDTATYSYEIEYTLVAYHADGSSEVIANVTDAFGGSSSVTLYNGVTKEICEQYQALLKEEIEKKCNAAISSISTKNGQLVVKK